MKSANSTLRHVLPNVLRAFHAALFVLTVMAFTTFADVNPRPLNLGSTPDGPFQPAANQSIPVAFPEDSNHFLRTDATNWLTFAALQFAVGLPADAPPVEAMVFLRDRDGHWFQNRHAAPLLPGATNHFAIAFAPDARGWESIHHHGAWHHRSRLDPQKIGIRFFSRHAWSGELTLVTADGLHAPRPHNSPPLVQALRANASRVGLRRLFELRFELPDRYDNPFDPDEVDVTAEIQCPDATTYTVHGFYYQDFYRRTNDYQDVFIPQGRPHWRVRYSPRIPGEHRLTLRIRDRLGVYTNAPVRFLAESEPAGNPFIRVSTHDPRFFEGCDETPFFAIGHNIRSPFDTRMDKQFPWRFRHTPGSRVYEDYFRKMAAAGQNLVEVWMCAWSLGLEWSPNAPGYHGVGDYNLIHAWELDRVLEQATANHLYINLVLNNHGRLSTWCDPEWNHNPMNQRNGGYLENPMDFFDHPTALRDTRQQLRYIVARWGFSPHIFAWELWSELDLIGTSGNQRPPPHRDPRVLQWHADIGEYLKQIDLNRHRVCTHISHDYRRLNPDMVRLPPLDHTAVDAYHRSRDPLHIAKLVRDTAAFGNPFGKPILITEFGGSPMAGNLEHLRHELRAAIWSSTASGLAGTPLFWWWHVIDEYDWYTEFLSVRRFMDGEDRRDPELRPISLRLRDDQNRDIPESRIDVTAIASPRQAFAYLAVHPAFQPGAPAVDDLPEQTGIQTSIAMPNDAVYRITFWDTDGAQIRKRIEERSSHGRLTFTIPPFRRDIAFKVHTMDSPSTPTDTSQ